MWRNNNLSIVWLAGFLLCLGGHAYAGWMAYNAERRQHQQPEVSFRQFVATEVLAWQVPVQTSARAT
jgi:hypothetical protein